MPLENRQIVEFLNYPDRALVAHAIDRANLTVPEWECIKLREYDGETVESAAERLFLSPGTVKNRYNTGMKKLNTCFSGLSWVDTLIKQ